jgi:acetylglutamate/LysW-gamma-L-alpha-aminoadipate kinase
MILIKGGGGKDINWEYIGEDIAELIKRGEQAVVMHGASATRDEIAKKLGAPTKTITSPSGVSSVYTDQMAIDVFLMVYCGLINKRIVATLLRYGVNAVGLSGIDGRLWEAKRKTVVYSVENGKTKLVKDNFTGKVDKVNADLIKVLLKHGYVPVICPPAISYENEIVNTDNDLASAVMAGALGIKQMTVLFEAPGMLKDAKDEKSLIRTIDKEKISDFLQFAQGRMKKKLLGVQRAFENGVETIYFGDGRIKNPVLNAIMGKGTIIS